MRKIIDLTLTLKNGMRGVQLHPASNMEEDGWNATSINLYSHAGTHMDAPTHFNVTNTSIDQIPLDLCLLKSWIVDIPNCREHQLITVDDLGAIQSRAEPGDGLLFRTGWSEMVHLQKYRDGLPRIGEDLANWCVSKKIKLVGVEPPSVADVNNIDELTSIHSILLKGEIIIVEGLCNLDQIEQEKVDFFAIPLKIDKCDGSPVRAFAVI